MNPKIKDIITLFLIQLVLTLPLLSASAYGLVISEVKANKITEKSAAIEWKTDVPANGTARYGKTSKLGQSQKHIDFISAHSLPITGLSPNTEFFFSVESYDSSGNFVLDTNSGSFYKFKTLGDQDKEKAAAEAKDDGTGPPKIDAIIPANFNRRVIDISGTTRAFSAVSLFVNDLSTPKKTLAGNEVGASGKFHFSQVQLEDTNTIKIAVTDKSNNKNEKTFEVTVDTEQPAVKLEEIKPLLSKANFTVSGNVNEPVVAKVFIDLSADAALPSQVKGLKAEKITQNSIELKWEQSKDKDFSHYVVYRDSIAIATTKPANYNLFIDALVDSDKEYKYEVSAVNTLGKESSKSEAVSAKTLSGGQTLNLQYPPVDIFEEFRKPSIAMEVRDSFNFEVKLDKGDGNYKVKLVFEDKAGNKFISEKNIELDTKKPTVKITTPGSGAFIYENYANEVTVIGKTKPNARVHLFVDRLPYSLYDQSSLQAGGLPNEAFGITDSQNFPKSFDSNFKILEDRLQDISEKELESKCPRGGNCESADKSVTADNEGNFRFEKVDLTAAFAFGTRIREVPVTEFRDVQLNKEAKELKKSNIFVIATDKLGQRGLARQAVSIGTCWSGNQSWDVIPLTQYQSPPLLSAERLAEGSESIYFFFNYTYIGRGANAHIDGVFLQKACGTRELLDPRFNISCQIMQGEFPAKLNPDGTITYSAVPLNRFDGMERFLENDWKNFFKAINNEMTFPFKIQIRYKHDVIDDTGQVRKITETQTACQELTYVVDNALLDPRTIVPDFMLYDFVDFLQKAVNQLTKVQEQIDRVIDYVAIGCLYTFFAHLVWKIYRNWVELSSEFGFKINAALAAAGNQEDQECRAIADSVVKANQLGGTGLRNLKLKYFSDPDLKKCFPAVYQAWQREENIYQWQRWSCDRIFGHTTPSRWTEKKSDDDIHKKITTQNTCAQDGGARGLPLRAENCRVLVASSFPQLPKDAYNLDDKCFLLGVENKKALFKLGRNVEGNLYELEKITGPAEISVSYAIRRTETQFMTAQPQTCKELCGFKEVVQESTIDVDGNPYVMEEGKPTTFVPPGKEQEKPKPKRISGCVTVNQCRAWHAKSDSDKEGIKLGKELLKGYTVTDKGYTSDCFYKAKPNYGVEVISETNPNTGRRCCCVNGETTPDLKVYYQPNDKDEKLEAEFAKLTGQERNQIVHESKSNPLSPPQQKESVNKNGETIMESYSDMKFSYRYSRIGYLTKKYNPNRYIQGRDLPACFGQDNQFYKIFNKAEELVIINPFKQDTATLQCAYLTGINQRLAMYKNLMSAMSTCLIDIRKDGRADAGVCKELFTQHVCGLLWQLVKFFQDGCTPDYEGDDSEGREAQFGEKIKLGLKGISQGITEAQSEMSEEYQNVKLNNLLGVGQGGVARKICLAAFGYDWDISARNLIDAAYTSPFATLVQPITRSREFLTIDPNTLRARYEYRASWLVNPGCDLENYRVELACVSRKQLDQYPNDVNCGAVGAPSIATVGQAPFTGTSTAYNQCDCLNLADEKTKSFFSLNTRLKQNQLSDKDRHDVIEDSYRYDHLKITLRTDRRITPEMQKNCFPPGHENGVFYRPIIDRTARDIVDCTVDPLSGVFKCDQGTSFFASKGIAQILEVKIGDGVNDVNPDTAKKEELEFQLGRPLYVSARVMKTGKPKCLRISITPDAIQDRFEKIELDGINEIGPIEITPQLDITGRGNYESPGIPIDVESQNNQNIVSISVKFIDNHNPLPPFTSSDVTKYSRDDTVIIDAIDINLQGRDYFPNVKEGDLEKVIDKTNSPNILIIKKDGQTKEKITVEDKTIRIETGGVIAVIKDVPYLEKQTKYPNTEKNVWSAEGVIKIYPPQQSSSSQQSKTITIGVYNMKERKDDIYDLSDCNPNDQVVVKPPYKITVSKQGAPAEALKPIIGNINIRPSVQVIGEPVEISAKITHPLGVKNVQIEIVGPQGKDVETLRSAISRVGDIFTFSYPTAGKPEGKYTGNIKATSDIKEGAERKEGTTSDQSFIFELKPPKNP